MKKRKYFLLILLFMFIIESCGPIIISPSSEIPPPNWFYPNRIENVRYVYFPEHMIYYDLSLQNYIYLNNGIWLAVKVLPSYYSSINLRRSRIVYVKAYRGDNISLYHRENNTNRTRTSDRSTGRRRKL
ncbi:MAG: hypothetical protein ACI9FW_000553 [Flavobacterium sp.]|jgi:hypothetical protein